MAKSAEDSKIMEQKILMQSLIRSKHMQSRRLWSCGKSTKTFGVKITKGEIKLVFFLCGSHKAVKEVGYFWLAYYKYPKVQEGDFE